LGGNNGKGRRRLSKSQLSRALLRPKPAQKHHFSGDGPVGGGGVKEKKRGASEEARVLQVPGLIKSAGEKESRVRKQPTVEINHQVGEETGTYGKGIYAEGKCRKEGTTSRRGHRDSSQRT